MNYNEYRMTIRVMARYCLIFCSLSLLISFTFYDSIYAFFALLPLLWFFIRYIRTGLVKKRKAELRRQFQDMIDSVSSALIAGYSVENAFYEARRDMMRLYGKDSIIVTEMDSFFLKLENGTPLEYVLSDFANRADVEDITDFSEIFVLAKRSGGDFPGIISKTVKIMKEKDDTEKEISVILSGRKYEQRIMSLIPFGIILYLRVTSGSFLSVLYHNVAGIIVMSICLAVYVASYLISEKIIDIKV